MDKNSLIQDIKNDLNSIKKQVEITLAKLAVLESMIELDNKLGVGSEELGVKEPVQESRDNAIVREPEPIAAPVAEPVEAPVEELGVRSEELAVEELEVGSEELGVKEPVQESRDNACIVREPEPIAVSVAEPVAESVAVSVAEPVEAPVAEAQVLRNLMSVISLGDKFRFRHDLFSDSNDLFKETIEILNTIEEFDEAVSYLQGKFNWDAEDATVVYFYDIIRPKF